MRWNYLVSVMIVCLLFGCNTSCRKDAGSTDRAPVHIIDRRKLERRGHGGFREWRQTADGFFVISVREKLLEKWKWNGPTVEQDVVMELPDVVDTFLLPDDVCLTNMRPGDKHIPWPLALVSLDSKEIIKKWDPPPGWTYFETGVSRNGKFGAVVLWEDLSNPPPGYDWENPRYRIGLVDIASKEIRWVAKFRGEVYGVIGQISVSDDGRYIAMGGWDTSVALVDASQQKALWIKRPSGVISPGFVQFSPDGSILYAAGTGGGSVHALETKTGESIRHWCATDTGEDEYGYRISCLAVSPDGSWIAAGTGPLGHVYLIDTRSDAKPVMLPHVLDKMTTILVVSFSPDSRHLLSLRTSRISPQTPRAPDSCLPACRPAACRRAVSRQVLMRRARCGRPFALDQLRVIAYQCPANRGMIEEQEPDRLCLDRACRCCPL
jgi:hypothetical protein